MRGLFNHTANNFLKTQTKYHQSLKFKKFKGKVNAYYLAKEVQYDGENCNMKIMAHTYINTIQMMVDKKNI